jgi:hypothetical protein
MLAGVGPQEDRRALHDGILQRLQQDVLHRAVDGHAKHEQESGDEADRERRQPPAHAARDSRIRVGGAAE